MAAIKGIDIIRRWVIQTTVKDQSKQGGVTINLPKKDFVDLNTSITAERLMRNGIDPNSITSVNQVDNIINQLNKPRVISQDNPEFKGIMSRMMNKNVIEADFGKPFSEEIKNVKKRIDSGVSATIEKILAMEPIDAMKDAMPTEEDRLVVAERQPPVYERPKMMGSSSYNKVISLSNPFDKGIGITLDTIDFVGDIFGDGENEKRFMKRLVNYESDYGTSPLTFRTTGKDGRGLAQVSPIAFDEIQRRLSEGGKLAQYIPIVEKETGIDITKIDYERDIHKPLHNIILMRLYLKIFPSQIPTSLADQGAYYKKYYNTHSKKAKGTPKGFILKNKNT